MPSLALYQPDIPQNAGNMLRLCACLAVEVHIIEPAGFDLSDRALKRAGMDYLAHVNPVATSALANSRHGGRRMAAALCFSRLGEPNLTPISSSLRTM